MNRKKFLQHSLTLVGGIVVGSALLESCKKKDTTSPSAAVNFTLDLSLSANAALNNTGGSVQHEKVIVIRTAGGFSALSNVCTHNGCTVGFNSGSGNLLCPCHGGQYDTNGNVLSGPPPSQLTKYSATLNGNILTVKS